MINDAFTRLGPFTSAKKAGELLGKARPHSTGSVSPGRDQKGIPGRARRIPRLSAGEHEQLLAVLNAERFADKSPAQAWAVLLDEDSYLASVSTMYLVCCAQQTRCGSAAPRPPTRSAPN